MTMPTVTEIRPVSPDWYLAQCRTLRNHVIVLDAGRVVFCGTDRADAARFASRVADANLTVEHTTGADSRTRPATLPVHGPERCPVTRDGRPAPYGFDGFGRPAGRPLTASDRRGVAAIGSAILAWPLIVAIVSVVA